MQYCYSKSVFIFLFLAGSILLSGQIAYANSVQKIEILKQNYHECIGNSCMFGMGTDITMTIEEDEKYPVKYNKFNGTHIFLDLYAGTDQENKEIPFKEITDKGTTIKEEKVIIKKDEKKQKLIDIRERNKIYLKYGDMSTFVNITSASGLIKDDNFDNDSDSAHDDGFIDVVETRNTGFSGGDGFAVTRFKYDLSQLPANASIISTKLSFGHLSGDTNVYIQYHKSNNVTWVEGSLDDLYGANAPITTEAQMAMLFDNNFDGYIGTWITGFASTWTVNHSNMTTWINDSFHLNNKNVTIMMNMSRIGTNDIQVASSEYAGAAYYKPYLQLRYEEMAGGGAPPAIPDNYTWIDWNATNETTYYNLNFTGKTRVNYTSSNESTLILSLYENGTIIYSLTATNKTKYYINLTNLTVGENWYRWYSKNNWSDNITLTIINRPTDCKITWNVTNQTTYTNVNFSGDTSVRFISTTNASLRLKMYENGSEVYSFNAINGTYYSVDFWGLTTGINWYRWITSVNSSRNYTLTISPEPAVKKQITFLYFRNYTQINISNETAHRYGYISWNYSTYNITVYVNGSLLCHGNVTNNTWNYCNISSLSSANITYLTTANFTWNTTKGIWTYVNTTTPPEDTAEILDKNLAFGMIIGMGLAFIYFIIRKRSILLTAIGLLGLGFTIAYYGYDATIFIGYYIVGISAVILVTMAYKEIKWRS